MTDWPAQLARCIASGEPAVLVTVAGVRGSAPREVGASMLVTAKHSIGTIGGGELEYQCSRIAAERLRRDADGCLRRFPLGSNCGQCCGGVVDVLFEPLTRIACVNEIQSSWSAREDAVLLTTLDEAGSPVKTLLTAAGAPSAAASVDSRTAALAAALLENGGAAQRVDKPGRGEQFVLLQPLTDSGFDIAVFGAGHVGSAVVQVLGGIDCNLRWIDSRRDIFPAGTGSNVQCINSADPARDVAALPPGAYYLVMTHSHALDLDITAAVLRRRDFAYCGLIGSATKRKRFEGRLLSLGISEQCLRRLVCPIGINGISGKKPPEIAIAASAEILRCRERQRSAMQRPAAQLHTLNTQQ